jgi:hypothetical protein
VCSARMGQLGVTVCWYYRPEQTIHPPHRQFWEGEVFKTSAIFKFSSLVHPDAPCRSLRGSSSGRYYREDRLPIYRTSHPRQTTSTSLVSRVPSLRMRLTLQRPRTDLCQDQKLEFMRTRGSQEECRFHANSSVRGASFS